MVKYSICIINYNNYSRVRQSLDSIFSQIDSNFEVIVVDNLSKDGSTEVLREYQRQGKLELIETRCSRGKGRHIAFEHSSGDYVIANMDMDDVFKPLLSNLIDFYHKQCEGRLLAAVGDVEKWSQNITIAPRPLLKDLGGWHDLQFCEDWDIWSRAAQAGKYCYTTFNLATQINPHLERKSLLGKIRYRYFRYRDIYRLGRQVFFKGEDSSALQKFIAILARVGKSFSESYERPFNRTFDPYEKKYFITWAQKRNIVNHQR